MEALLVQKRLSEAASNGARVTLLLRGAHRLDIEDGSVTSDTAEGETRFEIAGDIGIDGDDARKGKVAVSSGDIACLFVEDQK